MTTKKIDTSFKLAKPGYINYYVFGVIISGFIGFTIKQEFLTAGSFAESTLLIVGLTYLVSRYYIGKKMLQYNRPEYQADESRRKSDQLVIDILSNVIMPLCLNFSYAALFLFGIKFIVPQNYFGPIAQSLTSMYNFYDEYIKYPSAALLIILSILVIIEEFTPDNFKTIKKFFKYIFLPIKIVAILLYLVHVDTGMYDETITYKINREKIKSDSVTFVYRSIEPETLASGQNKDMQDYRRKLIETYVNNVIDRLDKNLDRSLKPFYSKLRVTAKIQRRYPDIENKVFLIAKSEPPPRFQDFVDYRSEVITNRFKIERSETDFGRMLQNKDKSYLQEFISAIENDQTSLDKAKDNENTKIIKELMVDAFDKIVPLYFVTEYLPVHTLIKDKIFDELKEKIISSFYQLLQNPKVTPRDLRGIFAYLERSLKPVYAECLKSINAVHDTFNKYYWPLEEAVKAEQAKTALTPEDHLIKEMLVAIDKKPMRNLKSEIDRRSRQIKKFNELKAEFEKKNKPKGK